MAAFLLCNCECLLVALRDRNHEREFASAFGAIRTKVVACPDDLWRYDLLQTSGVQRNRLSGCRTADVPADRPPRKRYPPILPRSRGDHMQLDRLKRREFITLIGRAAAWPLVAHAQPARRRPVVAFVHAVIPPAEMAGSNPISPLARAFVHGLHDLGWIEGQTVVIERRSAEGDPQRAPAIFAELTTRGVDVIAMGGSRWLRETAQQATKTIPTVLLFDADPVAEGVVPSLARPGGNLTGVIGTLETLVGHRRLRAGRSASAFCSIWRRTGSSMGERCSGGCAGKVPPAI